MRYQLAAVATAILSVCSQAQQIPPSDARIFLPSDKESALGEQLAKEVRRQNVPLGLVSADTYADKLGRELAPEMSNRPKDWKFAFIRDRPDSSTHEPISLLGGWVFIPAQLVLASASEGEFAGMLAHAMAHVAEGQQMRRVPVTLLAAIPLVFMGGLAAFGADSQNSFVPVGFVKTQREKELDADELAAKAMAALGFDPNELLNYIARVQREQTKAAENLSGVPSVTVRVSNLERVIQALPRTGTRRSSDSFRLIKEEVRRAITIAATPERVRRIPSLLHPNNSNMRLPYDRCACTIRSARAAAKDTSESMSFKSAFSVGIESAARESAKIEQSTTFWSFVEPCAILNRA